MPGGQWSQLIAEGMRVAEVMESPTDTTGVW